MSGEYPPTAEGEAAAWLDKADEDLRAARHLMTLVPPIRDVVGFHVQQAAEKLLKALLVLAGQDVPKIHDMEMLLRLLGTGAGLPEDLAATVRHLTPWAVANRYPSLGRYRGPTDDELATALAGAERLRAVVEQAIAGPNG